MIHLSRRIYLIANEHQRKVKKHSIVTIRYKNVLYKIKYTNRFGSVVRRREDCEVVKFHQSEVKLHQSEVKLHQSEAKLHQNEAELYQNQAELLYGY